MAFNELTRLKLFLVDAWPAQIMPTDDQTGKTVPVDYAWPGKHQKPTHVWFYNGSIASDFDTMGSGRKRRDQTVTFDVVIECLRVGKTIDPEGRNILQQQADAMVETIAGRIDEWVADNPRLGQDTASDPPIDFGRVVSIDTVGGPTTNGVGSTGVVQISYRLRPK